MWQQLGGKAIMVNIREGPMDPKDFLEKHWPKDGDSFFAQGQSWETNAMLHYLPHSFTAYAQGYKEAADVVVANVEETRWLVDLIVYPVCYLYRHYIELMMKALINLGRSLEDKEPGFPKHHKLVELWAECRTGLERASPDTPKDDFDVVENCINEFASMDPDGEGFRFPLTKDRQPTLSAAPKHLNVGNIRDVMGKIAGFLEGNYDYMSDNLDLKRELEAMYAEDYYSNHY